MARANAYTHNLAVLFISLFPAMALLSWLRGFGFMAS